MDFNVRALIKDAFLHEWDRINSERKNRLAAFEGNRRPLMYFIDHIDVFFDIISIEKAIDNYSRSSFANDEVLNRYHKINLTLIAEEYANFLYRVVSDSKTIEDKDIVYAKFLMKRGGRCRIYPC